MVGGVSTGRAVYVRGVTGVVPTVSREYGTGSEAKCRTMRSLAAPYDKLRLALE